MKTASPIQHYLESEKYSIKDFYYRFLFYINSFINSAIKKTQCINFVLVL